MKKALLALCAIVAIGASAETYQKGTAYAYPIGTDFHYFNNDEEKATKNRNWPCEIMKDGCSFGSANEAAFGTAAVWFNSGPKPTTVAEADGALPVVADPWNEGDYALKMLATSWWGFGNFNFALPATDELCRVRAIFRCDVEGASDARKDNQNGILFRITDDMIAGSDEGVPGPNAKVEIPDIWEHPELYRVVDLYTDKLDGRAYFAITFMPGGFSCGGEQPAFYLEEVSIVPTKLIDGDNHVAGEQVVTAVAERPDLTAISESGQDIPMPVNKLEIGKCYIFENARYSDSESYYYNYGYRYLWDNEIGSKLECSTDIDNNCVWIVEQGSQENAVYLRNAVTGGYLFTYFEEDAFYTVSSTDPIDIYVFDGDYYAGSIGLSTSDNITDRNFLNAAGNRIPYLCSYSFDSGSQWYAHEVPNPELGPQPLTGIKFTEDIVICPLGDNVKLRVEKIPFNAEGEISFTSSNQEVATVDSDGVVTGLAEGEATITAACGTITATCIVTVERQAVPVDWFEFNGIIGNVGESVAIDTRIWPHDATDAIINWYSSDPEVAAVDAEGVVWFNAAGSATVTAECQGYEFSVPFAVKEVMARALNVFPVEAIGNVGHEFSLLALHEPENTTDKSVTWESSDPAVATVNEEGHVSLVALGTAQITATSGEHTAVCSVTVDNTVGLTEMAVTGVVIDIVEGGIVVRNAPIGEMIAVYAVDGKVANGAFVESNETKLNLAAGIYIVKVSPATVAKVLIK